MPALAQFLLGDTGSIIRIVIQERDDTTGDLEAVDISGASVKKIIFRTPANVPIVKTATFTNTGTDGKMQYAAEATFFNPKDKSLIGRWMAEPYLEGVGTWSGRGSAIYFEVLPSLPLPP